MNGVLLTVESTGQRARRQNELLSRRPMQRSLIDQGFCFGIIHQSGTEFLYRNSVSSLGAFLDPISTGGSMYASSHPSHGLSQSLHISILLEDRIERQESASIRRH